MDNPIVFGGVLFIICLIALMIYAVWLQKKAVGTQGGAMSRFDHSLELQEQSVKQADELIAIQRETNALLREISAKLDQE